jgi:hypothetical protein
MREEAPRTKHFRALLGRAQASLFFFAPWRLGVSFSLISSPRREIFQFSEDAARRNRFMIALPTPTSGTGST